MVPIPRSLGEIGGGDSQGGGGMLTTVTSLGLGGVSCEKDVDRGHHTDTIGERRVKSGSRVGKVRWSVSVMDKGERERERERDGGRGN